MLNLKELERVNPGSLKAWKATNGGKNVKYPFPDGEYDLRAEAQAAYNRIQPTCGGYFNGRTWVFGPSLGAMPDDVRQWNDVPRETI